MTVCEVCRLSVYTHTQSTQAISLKAPMEKRFPPLNSPSLKLLAHFQMKLHMNQSRQVCIKGMTA